MMFWFFLVLWIIAFVAVERLREEDRVVPHSRMDDERAVSHLLDNSHHYHHKECTTLREYLTAWGTYLKDLWRHRHRSGGRIKSTKKPMPPPVYCKDCDYYTHKPSHVPSHRCLCPQRTWRHPATGKLVARDAKELNHDRRCSHFKEKMT